MTSYFIWAYAALTLGFWAHTLYRMATTGRRRERLFGLEERILLAIVALFTSSAWILLLPVYGLGRLQVAAERHTRGALSQLGQWRNAQTLTSRPAQRAA
jgi:hypothetical protein